MDITTPASGHLYKIRTTAKIDGHTIHVVLDSGASVSFLSRPAAARAGVKPDSEGVAAGSISFGLFGKGLETSVAPFNSFAIGGEEIQHTRLRVADLDIPDADMLLGADFFLSHRILVSKSQGKLYFTYNGGPVFQLRHSVQQAEAEPGDTTATAAGTAGTPPAGTPFTAAEFSRRAAASMARRDFAAAVADYSQAIALEPTAGSHYHDRANAQLNAGRPVLAMADLDQALRYGPGDVSALMTRGYLYLNAGDASRAKADFDEVLKAAPDAEAFELQIAGAYAQKGDHQIALHHYDAWIAAHPKSDALPQALNARCWTRAIWGKELNFALADCDAALKRARVSEVMDSRALVLLRLGRFDEAIAQYDAALKLQPKKAWSLYGRGLAKRGKGATADGDVDIQAALVLDSHLPEQARRYGLDAPPAGKP